MSYTKLWEKTHRKIAKKFMRKPHQFKNKDRKWLYENAKSPVLDVGCGNCIDAKYFIDYTGIDITPSFIKACEDFGVMKAFVMDARHLEFKDKSFETVYAKDLLLHYPHNDMMKILSEMCRVGRTVYVAWGIGGERWNRGISYIPNDEPLYQMRKGFHYNQHDLAKIKKEYEVVMIGEGTTITEIRKI